MELKKTESEEENLLIIPAVNVYKGTPMIRGEEGYEPMRDDDKENLKIQELFNELSKRYDKALITDLNGINKDRPQLELLKDLSSKMELFVDAGLRYADGLIDILITGAEKVVLGTKTLRNLEELEDAVELTENVILGISYDERIVSPIESIRGMAPSSLAKEAKKAGIRDVIFTDLNHIAKDTSFHLDIGSTLFDTEMNIYFHGRFEEGTKILRKKDLAGVIIEVETLL